MTRFKFFGFFLPLAIAGGLALGLMSVPVGAHHCKGNHPTEPPCGDTSSDTGEPALLTMTGAMSTGDPTADPLEMLPVRVTQDSGKWLYFADTSFESPGIQMAVDTRFCGVDPDFPGVNAPSDDDLLAELNGAFIPAGYFEIRIDKKKKRALLTIEYFITDGPLDGRIRIQFREDLFRTGEFPKVTANTEGGLDFPGTDFTMSGSIKIWWSNLAGLSEDKFMVCDGQVVEDGQGVTVQLVPDP